jgi:hypothetical protein
MNKTYKNKLNKHIKKIVIKNLENPNNSNKKYLNKHTKSKYNK